MNIYGDILADPEQYRVGADFNATNIVFPIKIGTTKYIIKKPRSGLSDFLIHKYLLQQDKAFLGTRKKASSLDRIQDEAKKLNALKGRYAPRYVDYYHGNLLRQYLEGSGFRSLNTDRLKEKTLEGALEAIEHFHSQKIIVGDADVKNLFYSNDNKVYWLDFEGCFDESNLDRAKAADLLKFVYSTYTVTRNKDTTLFVAELVAKNYDHLLVRDQVKQFLKKVKLGFNLWFATRIPKNDQEINDGIQNLLL
jgi:tRNA A-37 threonylcarbamoyl transferase component Bud32